MTTHPDSDALTIARWAWPEYDWKPDIGPDPDPDFAWRTGKSATLSRTRSVTLSWAADDANNVTDVERLMVERGHGEEYAQALCRAVLSATDPWPRGWEDFAMIRTAPLASIVRALVATIRKLEAKHA